MVGLAIPTAANSHGDVIVADLLDAKKLSFFKVAPDFIVGDSIEVQLFKTHRAIDRLWELSQQLFCECCIECVPHVGNWKTSDMLTAALIFLRYLYQGLMKNKALFWRKTIQRIGLEPWCLTERNTTRDLTSAVMQFRVVRQLVTASVREKSSLSLGNSPRSTIIPKLMKPQKSYIGQPRHIYPR
jgi:hypothetical protein